MMGAIDYPSISAADAARSEPDEDFLRSGRVKFNDLPGKICSAVGDCGHYQHCVGSLLVVTIDYSAGLVQRNPCRLATCQIAD